MWRNEPSHIQRELPLWELEFRWTPKSSKSDYRGQNSMDWKVPYIIGKLLKLRCLKWARMTHLDIWNTSYGQKKGWESTWPFDSRPLKVENRPNFFLCKWHATYLWKTFDDGYNYRNFSLRLVTKPRGCKVAGQEKNPRVMSHASRSARKCEGIDPHTPKGTSTLGVGVQVNSWIFKRWL